MIANRNVMFVWYVPGYLGEAVYLGEEDGGSLEHLRGPRTTKQKYGY